MCDTYTTFKAKAAARIKMAQTIANAQKTTAQLAKLAR